MKKIGDNYNIHPFQFNKPLDAAMDNAIAGTLGQIVREAYRRPAGDNIDLGLALINILNESGFELRAIRK